MKNITTLIILKPGDVLRNIVDDGLDAIVVAHGKELEGHVLTQTAIHTAPHVDFSIDGGFSLDRYWAETVTDPFLETSIGLRVVAGNGKSTRPLNVDRTGKSDPIRKKESVQVILKSTSVPTLIHNVLCVEVRLFFLTPAELEPKSEATKKCATTSSSTPKKGTSPTPNRFWPPTSKRS